MICGDGPLLHAEIWLNYRGVIRNYGVKKPNVDYGEPQHMQLVHVAIFPMKFAKARNTSLSLGIGASIASKVSHGVLDVACCST